MGKFVVALDEKLAPTDVEEGMRVGTQRVGEPGSKISIKLPLPPQIDASVSMMQVEEKPDVTYSDLGGCKD
jgi:26S proteasome regulatory subunit T1